MGGEPLDSVVLNDRGAERDRWFAVQDADGHFASGKNTRRFRRRDAVIGFVASTSPTGEVRVTGAARDCQVGDPALDDDLSQAMGTAVRVTPEVDVSHQDSRAPELPDDRHRPGRRTCRGPMAQAAGGRA